MSATPPSTSPAAGPADAADERPVTLFYSYAHEDERLRNELESHLSILMRRRIISAWHDRAITPGADWSKQIDQNLQNADLVLLLISTHFIASDYIMGRELALAMQRQSQGLATVVPIMLRDVDLQPEDAQDMPFVGLLKTQGLPPDLKPVVRWTHRDAAWTAVARGLRAAVADIRARRPAAPGVISARGAVRSAAPARAPAGADPLLSQVLEGFAHNVQACNRMRGGPELNDAALRAQGLQLVDLAEPKRVLWVDDNPGNNDGEAAALAALQIDVLQVKNTDEAMARLAAEGEGRDGFDLVISDWARPGEGALAGLKLLRALRSQGHRLPLIYYHGSFATAERTAVAAAARAAGAFGEAVLPAELMKLVMAALDG